MNTVIPFLLTYIFQNYCSNYTINIYIVFKFFIPRAFQKYNICRMYGDRSCICVFLYLCICVFTSLDTHNYLFWGLVLSRNHCWQILILFIRVYMPSVDCTLLSSKGGGRGGHFPKGTSARPLACVSLNSLSYDRQSYTTTHFIDTYKCIYTQWSCPASVHSHHDVHCAYTIITYNQHAHIFDTLCVTQSRLHSVSHNQQFSVFNWLVFKDTLAVIRPQTTRGEITVTKFWVKIWWSSNT